MSCLSTYMSHVSCKSVYMSHVPQKAEGKSKRTAIVVCLMKKSKIKGAVEGNATLKPTRQRALALSTYARLQLRTFRPSLSR